MSGTENTKGRQFLGIIFVRLNKVLVSRNARESKSNNHVIVRKNCVWWLKKMYMNGFNIVIYTGMKEKNANEVVNKMGIRKNIPEENFLLLTEKDLVIDGKFCTDAKKYLAMANNKFGPLTPEIVSFYDCEPLEGVKKIKNAVMYIVPVFIPHCRFSSNT